MEGLQLWGGKKGCGKMVYLLLNFAANLKLF